MSVEVALSWLVKAERDAFVLLQKRKTMELVEQVLFDNRRYQDMARVSLLLDMKL